jgi:hypothetical protein
LQRASIQAKYKHIPIDILEDFWYGTTDLYEVKHAGVVTYEIKRKLKKRNGRTITKANIQFIPYWFIFNFVSWLLMAHVSYTGT